MLDLYFDKCEQLILPNHHSIHSSLTNLLTNNNPPLKPYTTHPKHILNNSFQKSKSPLITTSKSKSPTSLNPETELHELRKAKMFLKQDNLTLQCQIRSLKQEIRSLKTQIRSLKEQSLQSGNYIISLEKAVERTSRSILSSKSKSPSTKTTKVLSKNNSLLKNKSSIQLQDNSFTDINSINKDVIIDELKTQNEKLKTFKDKVFALSQQNTFINKEVVNILQQILNHFNEMNKFYKQHNQQQINIVFPTEQTSYRNIKANVEELLKYIIKDNELRQQEYSLMMSYKDDVINDLQLKLNEYEKHNFTLKREVSTKDEKLLQQQNQISLYKELNKTTTQGIHKDTNTKQKQIIRSNSTNTLSKYNKTKSTQNNTMNTNTNKPKHTKHLNDVVKNSLNRTLNRIERIYGTLDIQHNNDHYYLNKYH